jgi:hypothetical protein
MAARRRERGSALVLAMLILLAMLGLGLIAMRTTTQNVAGTGNLRVSKQARYLAEMGLYHAITLINAKGDDVLKLRTDPTFRLLVRSDGQVQVLDANGNVQGQPAVFPVPAYFAAQPGGQAPPSVLGQFGDNGGLVTSYQVVVDGFTPAPPKPGNDLDSMKQQHETFCMVHFTARGFIADRPFPTSAQISQQGRENLFAEASVSAEVVLSNSIPTKDCTRL